MFETAFDQAAGLRTLFPAPQPSLLALACTAGAAGRRTGVDAIVRAIAQAGHRPLLIDLLAPPTGARRPAGLCASARGARQVSFARVDAGPLLPEGCGARELADFIDTCVRGRGDHFFDTVVVAADPLRLADLAAGIVDRIMLLVQNGLDDLAHLYLQVKAIHLAHGFRSYCTVFADAGPQRAAHAAHRRLADAAARFLEVPIDFAGVLDGLDERWLCGYAQPLPQRSAVGAH